VDAPADFRHMCGLLLALCGWLLVLVGCERPYVSVLLVGKLLALADCRFFQWSWRLGVWTCLHSVVSFDVNVWIGVNVFFGGLRGYQRVDRSTACCEWNQLM
jgi:hypothetical protein